ncbi:ankyrin repeat domain-containing protein 60 [Pelobates fuscus]|uniref:ankyrin repeat domain-containing protein 60 n=1 Tax=Pelobates fuscus TaxID=191477 RepID=UPI002FE44BAB
MAPSTKGKQMHGGTGTPASYQYSVKVRLKESGERFTVSRCNHHMEFAELKDRLELVAGIPVHLQRLSYIDEGDIPDTSTFKSNGIIPGGTISLSVWYHDGWSDIVKAATKGDLPQLKCLGVTPDSSFNTPNSLRLDFEQKQEWIASRASVALYIAAHRGHLGMVRYLLKNGANILAKTPLGNSALHVAAAMGNVDCITELLAYGAQTKDTNNEGLTALNLASIWGQKKVERHLFLFQWKERAASVKIKAHLDPSELFAHQKFDSKLKSWRCGSQAKRYMANLVHHKDFEGTAIDAPRKQTDEKRMAKHRFA